MKKSRIFPTPFCLIRLLILGLILQSRKVSGYMYPTDVPNSALEYEPRLLKFESIPNGERRDVREMRDDYGEEERDFEGGENNLLKFLNAMLFNTYPFHALPVQGSNKLSSSSIPVRVRKDPMNLRNFQLRVRKAPQSKTNNFQLRVRKFPSLDKSNFQLRVRKSPSLDNSNFQLRVRKSPSLDNSNFQLRVRKSPSLDNSNFQLRVRKAPLLDNSNFQLRVRKSPSLDNSNFQLRVRKSPLNDFQLRVRRLLERDENERPLLYKEHRLLDPDLSEELLHSHARVKKSPSDDFQLRIRKSDEFVDDSIMNKKAGGPESVFQLRVRKDKYDTD